MSPGELPKLEGVGGLERRGLCYTHLLRALLYRADIRALSGLCFLPEHERGTKSFAKPAFPPAF